MRVIQDQEERVEEEPLDPRIQYELEMMNRSTLLINQLENDLTMEKQKFNVMYTDSVHKLNSMSTKLGSWIHKAMPYYDSRLKAKELQSKVQESSNEYETALSLQTTAREVVEVAEQRYDVEKSKRNMAWQEMLNHATNKLLEAESDARSCQKILECDQEFLDQAQYDVRRQYKLNKRAISKSKSYFEKKSKLHIKLDEQKVVISKLEQEFSTAKTVYSRCMSNLESISEEIHNRRQAQAKNNNNYIEKSSPSAGFQSTEISGQTDDSSDNMGEEDSLHTTIHLTPSTDTSQQSMASGNTSTQQPVASSSTDNPQLVASSSTSSQSTVASSSASDQSPVASSSTSIQSTVASSSINTSTCNSSTNLTLSMKPDPVEAQFNGMRDSRLLDYDSDSDSETSRELSLYCCENTLKRRSASFIDAPTSGDDEETLTKIRSMSVPCAPEEQIVEGLDSDSVLKRSSSSVLDDLCLDGAVSHKYFDTDSISLQSAEDPGTLYEQTLEHHDYDILPTKLSRYQREFTLKRRSVICLNPQELEALELKKVLIILDKDLDKSSQV